MTLRKQVLEFYHFSTQSMITNSTKIRESYQKVVSADHKRNEIENSILQDITLRQSSHLFEFTGSYSLQFFPYCRELFNFMQVKKKHLQGMKGVVYTNPSGCQWQKLRLTYLSCTVQFPILVVILAATLNPNVKVNTHGINKQSIFLGG